LSVLFRRQPSGALTVRAQITALLPFSPASVARNPSFYTSFLWESTKQSQESQTKHSEQRRVPCTEGQYFRHRGDYKQRTL